MPYVAASFLGSFLLFLVQPMVAKMLLPSLGGTPSVWNTSMVFFQVALVAGYALAHLGMRLLPPRVQRRAQVVLLALPLLTLPVALPGGWDPPKEGSPVVWTLAVLALAVGPPFLVLSTCSPTIQHWFATSERTAGRDPYFLYAAGNVGSLLALLSYPLVIEPRLSTAGQARLFTVGYVALVALSALCALRRVAHPDTAPAAAVAAPDGADDAAPTWARRARWVAWSLVPSALMLGVTRHLSTDVMSVPMLWIAPLSVYLLTFVVAFGRRTDAVVRIAARGARFTAIPLVVTLLVGSRVLALVVVLHLVGFGFIALLGHGRLAADRPGSRHLTEFYLWVSIGGALGGFVTSLVAPLVFPTVIEYPLAIAAGLAMAPGAVDAVARARRRVDLRAAVVAAAVVGVAVVVVTSVHGDDPDRLLLAAPLAGVAGVLAHVLLRTPRGFAVALGAIGLLSIVPQTDAMVTDRSFFGVTRVATDADGDHVLFSGTTLHGRQDVDGDDPTKPLSYYHPAGPLGGLMGQRAAGADQRIGVVGLGAGSLAGYGRPGDVIDFYEIDPAVVRIAQDPRYFTFLSESEADVDIVMGDGRLNLERTDATYDVLVLDAFSSDSIPLHLLTREAMAGYTDRLAPGGVLAVHISNRYFDLEPVLARLAHEHDLAGVVAAHQPTAAEADDGDSAQVWVFLAPDPAGLAPLEDRADVRTLDPSGRGPLWTDDFSDILGVLDLG